MTGLSAHLAGWRRLEDVEPAMLVIGLECPQCGRRQLVPLSAWVMATEETEILPGWKQRGHPFTCPGPDCPSHTEMVLAAEAE